MLKLFVVEDGSDQMLRFALAEHDRNKVVSVLARIEARSALTRLYRMNRMTFAQCNAALGAFEAEARRMTEQTVDPMVLGAANDLIDRHDLRTLDAVQLGSAIVSREFLMAPDMRLIAADKALLHAAEREGFTVWNPSA